MARSKSSTRITVSLPDDDHTALSAMAERHDVSLSWLARRAVAEFLENHGRGDAQFALDLPLDDGRRKS